VCAPAARAGEGKGRGMAAAAAKLKERGSSIHFKQIPNISQSIAHIKRKQKIEPKYLLANIFRFENRTLFTASPDLKALYESDQSRMTKRSITEKKSSWWEATVNLPIPTHPISDYYKTLQKRFDKWRVEFEKLTGQSVRHIEVHLDEGHVDKKGIVMYNAHAHVLACRISNEKSNALVQRIERAALSKLQDITANALEMPRGETIKDREGKRGRPNIDHNAFREFQESLKAQEIAHDKKIAALKKQTAQQLATEAQKAQQLATEAQKAQQLATEAQKAQQLATEAQKAQLDQAFEDGYRSAEPQIDYAFLRGFLKASQQATQRDYQTLKKMHEMKVDLSELADRVENQAGLVFEPIRLLSKVFAEISEEHHFEIACAVLTFDEKRFAEHNISIKNEHQKSTDTDDDFDFLP